MDNLYKECAAAPSNDTSTENDSVIHLDYSLKTPEERSALVQKIIEHINPSQLTHKYLDILSDYILDARSKAEKKDKTILTNNRLVTVNKRETSYEDLVSKFENGEDGVSNLAINDKAAILSPKIEISAADLEEIPGLKDLKDQIQKTEAAAAQATGKRKYFLKKAIIEMRRDQYVLKNIFKPPITSTYIPRGGNSIHLDEHIHLDENQEPVSDGLVNLFNPTHISAILCNYDILKEGLQQKFGNDFYYLLEDFDKYKAEALAQYPLYSDLVKYKIAGKTNLEIQQLLAKKYNKKYTVEYISALWRNKIPKLIAEKAKEDYLIWYFTFVEKGTWKKCSKCGQIKLAHKRFFSRNNTSKSGFYSICKECRNKKKGE